MTKVQNWEAEPCRVFRFFLHDPQGEGFMFFRTETERDAAAQEAIDAYLVDGWSEEVENVCVGTVTGAAERCHVRKREDQVFDKEGYDQEGIWWGPEWDLLCNYQIRPINGEPAADAPPAEGESCAD